jgi:hypothetical protein
MTQINTNNIDAAFPLQGQDNPSQGFRDNFSYIKIALDAAAQDITSLENIALGGTGTLVIAVATATNIVQGTVKIGNNLSVSNTGTVSVSNPFVLHNYTTSNLNTISSTATGSMVFVTNAPGGAQPCFFDGTNWKTVSGTII